MKFKIIKLIKLILILAIIILLSFMLKENINKEKEETINKLSFNQDKIRIKLDSNIKLGLTISPKEVKEYNLNFTSSNKSVAIVDNNGIVTPLKPGKTTISVSSSNKKLKDECEVIVLKEYLFFLGDSNWELIAGERKGGDTKKPYEIKYRGYKKDKDLFFIAKSGAGLKWMSGNVSKDMEKEGYSHIGEKQNSSENMKKIIEEHEEAYFKIIISMGTNDIKFLSSKEKAKEYGKAYAKFYNSLSKSLPEDEIYIYSVIPIGKKDSCNVYKENDFKKNEHRNTKVEIFNSTIEKEINSNIKFINTYSYFNFLANEHKICFTKDGHWNKELTQKVYDKILETLN